MKKRLLVIALAAIVGLAGCSSMAPDYARPEAPVPAGWSGSPPVRGEAGEADRLWADIPWQEFFVDEQLRRLIGLALENNRDLRIAALNIERSRAQYRIQRSALFPQIDAVGGYNKQRLPDSSGFGQALTLEQYDVGLGISSWEVDFFGRVRSLKEQALEEYLASEQARRSVQISLVAEVAANFLTLAADRERLTLARETLLNQQESYRLTRSLFDAGVATALDVNQAQTSVDTARVDIARYANLVAQDENALALVVGTQVPAELLPSALAEKLAILNELPANLSSEVLLERPDILLVENLLKAANANIGAARAAFFPRITLMSSIGTSSDALNGLFKEGSLAWNFAPQISVPIFDAGRNRANLRVAEIDRDVVIARYEQAIQGAFREVADALSRRGTIDDQLAAQQSLTDATAASYRLSEVRYEKGVDSYLAVLDSQRSLYAAQQNLITTRLTRLSNLATLYKVLGGGWEERR